MASDDDVQLCTLSPRPTTAVHPSPARDSLRGNLKAAETDHGLKKRKSWFGSMRDVFHKGALQAKAAVDAMRGEGVKHEDEMKQMMPPTNTPEPRESLDSATSTTPLKSHTMSPQLGRRRTFSPKEAVSSLRHHLPGHGSRSKRASLHTIIGRTSTDAPSIAGPEQFVTSPKSRQSDEIEQHRRKSSVAGSLVGSIRGLARRPTKSKTAAPAEPSDPEEDAGGVPLPSSPISIPSAAPVLGLDLGQPGMDFRPAELAARPKNPPDEDTRKLRDSANFAIDSTHKRNTSLPLVPDEFKMHHTHPAVKNKSTTPSEMLLQLPTESVKPSPPRAPTTPLPGTNLTMELDGADDSGSSGKKSQVFERSVTPTTEKDRKELRTMCSLDAIAEACTSASKDSAVSPFESVQEEQSRRGSAGSGVSPTSNSNPFISPRPSVPSTSTVSQCPSDMPDLERMKSDDSTRYQFGSSGVIEKGLTMSPGPIDDPFDDRYVASHGPPSPVRSVKLPLRLKIKGPSEQSGEVPSEPMSPEVQYDIEHYTFGSPTKLPAPSSQHYDPQQNLHRNYAVPHNLSNIEQRPQSQLSPEHTEVLSDDDTMSRAQSLWNSDVVYPGYEYPEQSDDISEDGMSPHGGPVVSNPLWHGEVSPNSSPGRSTWKAGLGEGGFRFSIDNWRPGPQPVPDPQPLSTPKRRSMDVSIDSVSADESWETPLGSRASNTSDRTPSMGNPLEFQLKRSNRNMRYNALHQEHTQHEQPQQDKKSSSPVRMQARFIFGGSSGDMDANEAQYYPDYSTAYPGSGEGTPNKGTQPPLRVSSEDSITMSLRSASDNMERLAALLGRIDSDDDEKSDDEQIYDAFTTASSPRSKHPRERKDRGMRSDSPSPEKMTSHPLPATPVLGPQATPSNPHNNPSHDPFTILDLENEMMSSPHSDDTETAELPTTISVHDIFEQQYQDHDKENRIASGDTLDQTLDMLSSPDSGYNADESSVVQTPDVEGEKAVKQIPRRYRSQSRRQQHERKVLGATSGNRG